MQLYNTAQLKPAVICIRLNLMTFNEESMPSLVQPLSTSYCVLVTILPLDDPTLRKFLAYTVSLTAEIQTKPFTLLIGSYSEGAFQLYFFSLSASGMLKNQIG